MLFKMKEGCGKHHIPMGKNKTKIIRPGDTIEVSSKDELKGSLDKFERIDFKEEAIEMEEVKSVVAVPEQEKTEKKKWRRGEK